MDKTVAFLLIIFSFSATAQYDGAGGEPGSLAIPDNSPFIIGWADSIIVDRGWQDIADTTLGKANQGFNEAALGPSDRSAVSLGDGGIATIVLAEPMANQQGFEFCIFENGFQWPNGYFLELAFVEVSSDGKNFVRFQNFAKADTITQLDNNAAMQPSNYFNLAGKHQGGYGTPFDLEEFKFTSEVDENRVTHIRIVDVVGSLLDTFASRDSEGRKINDPWPTGFESSGFDLDALALLSPNTLDLPSLSSKALRLPNPLYLTGSKVIVKDIENLICYNANGQQIAEQNHPENLFVPSRAGIYLYVIVKDDVKETYKICVLP